MTHTPAAAVADRLDISDLVHRYAQAVDRVDPEGVAALFCDDGEFVVFDTPGSATPRPPRQGRADIATAIAFVRRYRATSHCIGNHVAEIVGDDATGETRCVAHHVIPGDPARLLVWHLRYRDQFTRRDGPWLIRRRELHLDFTEERPLL